MLEALRGAGLKVTPQRMAVVRRLADDPTHPTAQELFDRLRPELPTTSFATVYNTLSTLVDAGLCATRTLARGPARFDPNVAPHDHAICDRCGAMTDVMPGGVGEQRPPRIGDGFSVRVVERVYRGVCVGCAMDRAADEESKSVMSRRSTRDE